MKKTFLLCPLLITAAASFSQINSAQNGLSQNASAAELGGTLLKHTNIDLGSSYNLGILKGSSNYFSILNNGNVGIGTATPGVRLDVNGETQFSLNNVETFKIKMPGPQNWNRGFDFNITDADGVSNSFGLKIVGYNNDGNRILRINQYNTTGMAFGGGTYSFENRAYFGDGISSPAHSDFKIWLNQNTQNPAETGIKFYTEHNPSTPLMSIMQGGNVGIGTATPSSRLDVAGQTQITLNVNEFLKINMPGPQHWNKGFDFNITDADGVSNSYGLKIVGYNNEGNRAISIGQYNATGVVFGGGSYGFANRPYFVDGISGTYHSDLGIWLKQNTQNPTETGIKFYTESNPSAPLMSIMQGGNVGIGTATPQSKLAVNGDITAKKVKVTPTGWPDYVFQPAYILRPLPELEQFIHDQQHLPEIPAAAEVEKNGIDIGDNQALLLKKIEELTLYVIDLNKKVQQQHEEITRLKQQLRK